eukprot:GHVO01050388.1.p1 GENE.GHVO01050388.1~~GHVO01050388.1.p1  ORF type:complete len:503 (+),score=66.38 GHVO01050388.1:91-1599(+)
MESRIESRRKDFKKASTDPRRKREDATVQIRKADREAQLTKRRQEAFTTGFDQQNPAIPGAQMSKLQAYVDAVNSSDPQGQYEGAEQFRRLLSIANNPPIQDVINSGVVPRFVEFLKDSSRPNLQFESAWVLTNIASGTRDQTKQVIDNGAVPIFVCLLSSNDNEVREQAVWALGNIAGDNPQSRDLVLREGALEPVLNLLRENKKPTLLRNATWTLSNLCRGKPEPILEWVYPALPVLKKLIYEEDTEVLADACWALSYISDGPQATHIEAVVNSGVCQRLVELLSHKDALVLTPALRAVGNIVTGSDLQTDKILACEALPLLNNLLSSNRRGICREACWAISNITAGNKTQIQQVITNHMIPQLIALLKNSEIEIRREAAWAISNAASGGSHQQVDYLVECGCIKPLCDLLDLPDMKIVSVTLEALLVILKVGQKKMYEEELEDNPYVDLIEKANGSYKMKSLQDTPKNQRPYQQVIDILNQFFPGCIPGGRKFSQCNGR